MSDSLQWGLLATGAIARAFARGLANSKTGKLAAVASRDLGRAQSFAAEFGAQRAYGSYEALLADPQVQAVYISTPHPMHALWAIAAAEAGKHVLVEKPMALNHAQAMAMVEAARAHDVFMMEAFMYRCHPQTRKLVELLGQNVIGQVRMIQASFGFSAAFKPESRLFDSALGGGGILDVGCYPVSMARLIAGAASGLPFADPVDVRGSGQLVPQTGVDAWAAATLKFASGIVAQVATGIQANLENTVRIFGSEGTILLANPWVSGREGGCSATLRVQLRSQKEAQEIATQSDVSSFALEADVVAASIARRQAPQMNWDDSLGNMRVLDAWRQQVGVVYQAEKPPVATVHGRPLTVAAGHRMKYGTVPGLDKKLSRVVMGVDNICAAPHVAALFDDFYEKGGNTFDTAFIYGGGQSERAVGAWLKSRGVRNEIVIIDKGAHTPHCLPQAIGEELRISLQRLGLEHVDLYLMHRDNPEVPVGEFIDAMNEQQQAGRLTLFGVSNWTVQRIDQANAWAKAHGRRGIAAVSNNFSLARMIAPPWEGCVASSDPETRRWHQQTQTPLLSWSSQARGFFVPQRAAPDKTTDNDLVRCWYSPDNFQRQARAVELAGQYGVEPVTIALAYVLCQPFPTFALIGPRSLAETRTSLPALDLELTPREVAWLNLEDA
jgi:predicted dehydrogenase/aryl-alcohol dehydrogenase-like predicted oxidoreductase